MVELQDATSLAGQDLATPLVDSPPAERSSTLSSAVIVCLSLTLLPLSFLSRNVDCGSCRFGAKKAEARSDCCACFLFDESTKKGYGANPIQAVEGSDKGRLLRASRISERRNALAAGLTLSARRRPS